MDLPAEKIALLLGSLATFIPALLGALKTYRNSTDSDVRLKALEDWQKSQDTKLGAILEDQSRGFREQGQHRNKLDQHVALLENQLSDIKRKAESIPTRSEFNYQRPPMELTPLPITTKVPAVELDEAEELARKKRKK